MTMKDSSTQDEPKPVEQATQADEQKPDHKAEVSASLPVVNPSNTEADEPKPDEPQDETDRKQDEAIDSIADQTEWMEKQTKWLRTQAIASIALGVITLGVLVYHGLMMRKQWEAMQHALDEARISREIENRAFVMPGTIKLVEPEGRDIGGSVEVTFVNIGKTPARDVLVDVRIEWLENEPPEGFHFPPITKDTPIESKDVIVPQAESPARIVEPIPKPNPEQTALAQQGRIRLFVYGIIRYKDMFDKTHTTRFCQSLLANVGFAFDVCAENNTFD